MERPARHKSRSHRNAFQHSSERSHYMKHLPSTSDETVEGKVGKHGSDSPSPVLNSLQHRRMNHRRKDEIQEKQVRSKRRSRDLYHKKSCSRSHVQTDQTSRHQQQSPHKNNFFFSKKQELRERLLSWEAEERLKDENKTIPGDGIMSNCKKLSELLPECRIWNIEARGGRRDFRKWFQIMPPNVKVDKDLRTDSGIFKKDNFQSMEALDKYLGIHDLSVPSYTI